MKKKISITLSSALRLDIDHRVGPKGSRSAFIEKVLQDHFRDLERQALEQRNLELIPK